MSEAQSSSTALSERQSRKRKRPKENEDSDALANVIKGVHKRLKQKYLKSGKDHETVWNEHSEDRETLKIYADAMQKLATEHWSPGDENRIEWIHKTCLDYFRRGGMKKWLDKDARRREHTLEPPPDIGTDLMSTSNGSALELLDVGSCYNPFDSYEDYRVTAIDLQPANDRVYRCDFLRVPLGPETVLKDGDRVVASLRSDFDVVAFCLLLEYLPSPEQRWSCVCKAWEALRFYGLLVIVTPDSHKQHRGAARMKEWKMAIERAGFRRIKYEKMEHFHGLAFRKIPKSNDESPPDDMGDKLTVPQDFNTEISDDDDELGGCSKTAKIETADSESCSVSHASID